MADETTPETPVVSDGTPLEGTPTTPPTPAPAEERMFPESHVKELRGEAEATRKKLRDAETKLRGLELEKLTESERILRERDDARAELEEMKAAGARQAREALQTKVAMATFADSAKATEVAPLLQGATEDEMSAHAKRLLKIFTAPVDTRLGNQGGGNNPSGKTAIDAARDRLLQSGDYSRL